MANEFKSGFVTFIGRPNVGKSTLMNRLIGQKIAITSSKPQTTRNRIQTVYTDERGQIIFLDTPGINRAKNKLGNYMLQVAERTLNEVDVVLWLVEPSTFIGGGEKYIIEQLSKIKTPIILVINKIDTVEEKDILEAIDTYKDVCEFAEIIPVSALKGKNTDDVIDSIYKYLDEGPMYFDEDTITDQPERQICAELIREKALRLLSQEIPHGIAVVIDALDVTVAFISNIENDRVKMNLRVLSYYAKLLNVSIDYLLRPESDENGEKDDVLNKEILRLLEKFSTDDKEKFVKVLRILCKQITYLRHKKSRMTGSFFIHSFSLKSDLIKITKI